MMKKRRFALMLLGALAVAFAADAEPRKVLTDGFEEIVPVIKATDNYYMKHIRDGWDFGMGPIAFSPKGWLPNVGKGGRYMGIDSDEDATMKPFVHSGHGSFRIGVVGGKGGVHVMRTGGFKPGRYRMSVWTRGTGSLSFVGYTYRTKKNPGCVTKESGCRIPPHAEWTKTEATLDLGASVKDAGGTTFAIAVSGGDVYIDDLEIREAEKGE